jgi:DNA-binding ferritin-like protein
MMRRRKSASFPDQGAEPGLAQSRAMQDWGSIPFAELSSILVDLRFLYMKHQTNHWLARGDSSYGDHLLFQRIYEAIAEQIDRVAERAMGLGCEINVDLQRQASLIAKIAKNEAYGSPLAGNSVCQSSLTVEKNFLASLDEHRSALEQQQKLSYGLDNMLAGLADEHEQFVYLLQQRCR